MKGKASIILLLVFLLALFTVSPAFAVRQIDPITETAIERTTRPMTPITKPPETADPVETTRPKVTFTKPTVTVTWPQTTEKPTETTTEPLTTATSASGSNEGSDSSLLQNILDKILLRIQQYFRSLDVKSENVPNTMKKNAIHMLRSVKDKIGDSFIITTRDGKVIVIDGGSDFETAYFIEYLKAVTGQKKPHIDAWFLSHPHDDHCEVFLKIVRLCGNDVTFDKVYANFDADPSFFIRINDKGLPEVDPDAKAILEGYQKLPDRVAKKTAELQEGDVFNIGAARFTVFYTFNPIWNNCNAASTIMRMDLGGTSVMFTGDANKGPGDYVVNQYGGSGLLKCDVCKMAHHGQAGVDRNFYEAVAPRICLWPTPSEVWNDASGLTNTREVRDWMDELGVEVNYVAMNGSQVLYL